MTNTSLSLGKHWESFIKEEISDGRYESAGEVIRAGLQLLEAHNSEAKLAHLRTALIKGELSGVAGDLNMEQIRDDVKSELDTI